MERGGIRDDRRRETPASWSLPDWVPNVDVGNQETRKNTPDSATLHPGYGLSPCPRATGWPALSSKVCLQPSRNPEQPQNQPFLPLMRRIGLPHCGQACAGAVLSISAFGPEKRRDAAVRMADAT